MLTKAKAVSAIDEIIKKHKFTAKKAAETLDISESELIAILSGRFKNISEKKINKYLERLEKKGRTSVPTRIHSTAAQRLEKLASETYRSKTFYATEAINYYIDAIEQKKIQI